MSNQQQEKVYANGLTGKKVETKFGEINKLSFKVSDFVEFLKQNENEDGWVSVDLLPKKDGNGLYGVLNTYVKTNQQSKQPTSLQDLPF